MDLKYHQLIRSERFKNFLFVLPFFILVVIFAYYPLRGWIYAFFNYKPGLTLPQMDFLGFKMFGMLFSDPVRAGETARVLLNTFGISALGLLVAPLPMFFAIFLVELPSKRYSRAVQTLTTLPHFISWVLMYSFAFSMFSVGDGFINRLFLSLGIFDKPFDFLANPNHVWLTMTGYSVWKELGWSAIIYLAAIMGIDSEIFEAANIDGASKGQMIVNITIPLLMPTFFVLFILNLASILNNGYDQYLNFQNFFNKDSIEVLDLYIYNVGLRNGLVGYNYSFAVALGIIKSILSVVLLFGANSLSQRIRKEKLF